MTGPVELVTLPTNIKRVIDLKLKQDGTPDSGHNVIYPCPLCRDNGADTDGDNLYLSWNPVYRRLVYHCARGCVKAKLTEHLRKLGLPGIRERRYYPWHEDGQPGFERHKQYGWAFRTAQGSLVLKSKVDEAQWREWKASSDIPSPFSEPYTVYNDKTVLLALDAETDIALLAGEPDSLIFEETTDITSGVYTGIGSRCREWYLGEIATRASAQSTIYIGVDRDKPVDGKIKGLDDAVQCHAVLSEKECRATIIFIRSANPTDKDIEEHLLTGGTFATLERPSLTALEGERQSVRIDDASRPDGAQLDTDLAAFDDYFDKRFTLALDITERDVALAIFHAYPDRMHHLPKQDSWLYWRGQIFEESETWLVRDLIQHAVELSRNKLMVAIQSIDPNDKKTNKSLLWSKFNHFSAAAVSHNIVSILRDLCRIDDESFDADTRILACQTGVLDREAAKHGNLVWLRHDPARKITRFIELGHDPNATCAEWKSFLDSSIPSEQHRHYLQVLIGFSLVGGIKKKKIVNLIGPLNTGKTTFVDIIEAILHQLCGSVSTREITQNRNNGKFDFHGLRNSRLAFTSEAAKGAKYREDDLKRLTGGGRMQTEAKGEDPISWLASVMLFIDSNQNIYFDPTDEALRGRLVYINFARKRDIDYQLKKKLEAEISGIFNWILEGVLRYFREGELTEPQDITEARDKAITELNPVFQFIEQAINDGHLVVNPEIATNRCCKVTVLHGQYTKWFFQEEIGKTPLGRKHFSQVVASRYSIGISDGHRFTGLAPRKATS